MKKTRVLMIHRKKHILFIHILLTALLAGGSSALRAQVVIKGSVYGGGNEGEVQNYSFVNIETGTIEHNVFGGGNNADVLGNDTVKMSDGTVKGNIYGGGNLGDVGTIDKSNLRSYKWANKPYPALDNYTYNNTGICYVEITGGTVGPTTPTEELPGNVFGGGKGSDYDFWCEKGMVYSTKVKISNGTVNGNVYGGGEVGRVETDTHVTIGPETGTTSTLTIKGNVFGAGKGKETHGYSALVRGNTDVYVQNGAQVNHNVYGGGEIASVGKYNVDANGMPYSLANNGSGICRVNIPGSTHIIGDVFGGGKGIEPLNKYINDESYTSYTDEEKPKRMTLDGEGNSIWQLYNNRNDYFIYLQTLALATQTEVLIDPGTSGSTVISTQGNVYGGSENGLVQHSTEVTVQGNCQIGEGEGKGNIYGGGKGLENVEGAGLVGGDATVNINNGIMLGSVYGGGVLGATKGNITVNINGGTVNQNVYGGGAYAHTNTSNWSEYVEASNINAGDAVDGLYEMSFGGIYTLTEDAIAVLDKKYYNKEDAATWANSTQKSALNKTRVNLLGGTITGDAYGGALGDNTHEPLVYGDILVDLNGTTSSGTTGTKIGTSVRGCVVNQVFGCNNAKGTPKGNVLVHVYATQNKEESKTNIGAKFVKDISSNTAAGLYSHLQDSILIAETLGETVSDEIKALTSESEVTDLKSALSTLKTAISAHSQDDIDAIRYDVQAVYGGGNKAAYEPVDPTNNKTQVYIEGCDVTSINDVYGGGNAAAVPSTNVTVNSAYEINYLFGGGNGSGDGNPGADVGTHKVSGTPTNYGSGMAISKLYGGEIHVVYGGSNEKGNIVGGTSIEVNEADAGCTLKVGQLYGAGNNAKMDGGTDIVMGCMPAGVIEEIYAGARNADVAGDVKLTITSGTFGRVFGGNKHGGKLQGSITVNIEETGGCAQPLIIGELYGGGNLADYSIYGYDETTGAAKESGSRLYADPKLNVRAFTSIGAIYGGGYRAKMVANPTVDINVVKGSHAATAYAAGTIEDIPTQYKDGSTIKDGDPVDLAYPAHEANKIGAIGNVFGGGNLAPIVGNATVNVGTEKKVYFKTEPVHLGTKGTDYSEEEDGTFEATVEGAIIKGSVYGGGNEADITGNTQVNICAKYDETASEYRRVAPGSADVTIDHDVFGAGKGIATNAETALVSGDTQIVMFDGEVKQSVYGGGELSQVGGDTYITVNGGTIGTSSLGGETYGNIYGGGKGNTTNVRSGLIKGNTNITVNNLVATAGNAEYYGVSAGTMVSSPEILHNIYGGGAHGSVGTYTYVSEAADAAISGYTTFDGEGKPTTGVVTINILGGTFGTNGNNNGMIFGSSRGDIDAPNTIYDKVAWVYDTHVNIGTEDDATSGPRIWGSIYGSGENGHTYHDAAVTIKSGTIGDPTTYFENRGNVYGGGCGTDKYHSTGPENHDGDGDKYNHLAGIVKHDATVTINGGSVANNVYGAGSMGKVGGSTFVTINTDGAIGVDGTHDDGNVYGAARGELDLDTDYEYSTVGSTTVTISKGTVKGNVFGGGKAGKVKGSVVVNVTGGKVIKDVYGGGALADTNTDNWNAAANAYNYDVVFGLTVGSSDVSSYYIKEGSSYTKASGTAQSGVMYYERRSVIGDWVTPKPIGGTDYYTTTLNLTGGVIGNAYGGGLGQRTGINGATSDIAAMVYGDVLVTVNGTAFTSVDEYYSSYWYKNSSDVYVEKVLEKEASVPKTGRVFGCNNLNGSPKGDVKVIVYQTKKYDAVNQQVIGGHEINQYEIRGVYGGGNLSHYEPADGKGTSVEIHDCSNTSIEKVYGGGNAADVPATDVKIYGCFDIHYVFGGGNGADVIYRNGRWEENDGANVNGNASVSLYGGTISDAFIGSDTKGRVYNATGDVSKPATGEGECALKLTNYYGSSKRADVYGDVTFTVSACAKSEIENIYAGSYDAQIHGNITMTITSGILKNVFGGNDRLGSIGGNITINIEEADACKPIIIQNLYGGGFNAPYPGEGASKYKGPAIPTEEQKKDPANFDAVDHGKITINVKSCTRIDNIYGGGKGYNATVTGATEINVNMAKGAWAGQVRPVIVDGYAGTAVPNVHSGTGYVAVSGLTVGVSPVTDYYTLTFSDGTYTYTKITDPAAKAATNVTYYTTQASEQVINDIGSIGNIFGGGDEGAIWGNTSVNIGSSTTVSQLVYNSASDVYAQQTFNVLGAHITGNVYGGGNLADVINGNTKVYIGTADGTTSVAEGASGVTIAGDVFGGGKGNAQLFTCEKAMVGHDGDGYNLSKGNTEIVIGHGTVGGSVYGGGEIARVENNTSVTIGLGVGNTGSHTPVITGNVFGAGKGIKTHGYSALVRGKSTVTIGGDAWVQKSVYGGGEISSVGRFNVADADYHDAHPEVPIGMPYSLKDEVAEHKSGTCEVTIQNYAEIGPNDMEMPNFTGHVFGAGKGFLPESYTYVGTDKPQRMQPGNSWDTFNDETAYIVFIETLGMAAETDVTIKDHAFVKGSVYGGSENAHVLKDTQVTIQDDCQVGNGYNTSTHTGINRLYSTPEWAYDGSNEANSLAECNHWVYGRDDNSDGKKEYLAYDVYNVDGSGNPKAASDGHTFYGNVFGGGSGYFPYRKNPNWEKNVAKSASVGMPVDATGYSDGLWLRSAGAVYGNTNVNITGGHILTSVYGGNEQTDVGKYTKDVHNEPTVLQSGGTCTITMSGGTIGVPRTVEQIDAHPVTCYLFGAGKGDQRVNFNTWTNVGTTNVTITGGRIYGSALGGGEDGHVLGDAVISISGSTIGTTGKSYYDGNVFGGGRGFSGEAQTAGTIGGNVALTISGGTIFGNVYGGGRLASVGTYFTSPTDNLYGQLQEDEGAVLYTAEDTEVTNGTKQVGDFKSATKSFGHVAITISGGTVGSSPATGYSGNVFGGSMGRLDLINGTINPLWPELAQVKSTTMTINESSSSTHIYGNVYGGGEFGTVRENATMTITAGTIDGSVFGGGLGSDNHTDATPITVHWVDETSTYKDITYVYTPMQWAGTVGGNTLVSISGGAVKTNVYGGGQLASVGIFNYLATEAAGGEVTGIDGKHYTQPNIHKHAAHSSDGKESYYDFGLSWPYEFEYVPNKPNTTEVGGKTTVNITGGTIGDLEDTGYIYGGGKGQVSFGAKVDGSGNHYDDIAEQRYTEAFCANVRETHVNIGAVTVRTVYGGGEDGHVYEDANVTINNGTIGHSVFGGGKGMTPFTTYLWNPTSAGNQKETTDNVHSWTAGKVYGNTSVTMNSGSVGWFIYGGGNLASVGKGNYSGGTDDYSIGGYGELPPSGNQALWENANFLNSGKSTVTILGGRVGPELTLPVDGSKVDKYIDEDGIPYGSVFGGSRGQAAKSVRESPRYRYVPDFFLGYVNKAFVNIGGTTESGAVATAGPTITGSIYGGGQDGHVRNNTEVKIFKGSITGQGGYETAKRSGNVFGGGSGIGKYTDSDKYLNNSSGSVTCTTLVEVSGTTETTTIAGNIYGGGALSSVGPYRPDGSSSELHAPAGDHKSCSYTKVDIKGGKIEGSVFGASRGPSESFLSTAFTGGVTDSATPAANQYNPDMFATDIWSDVNISGGTIDGNVYGGGEGGRVTESTSVILTDGVVGTSSEGGDVYGGGKGTLRLAANIGGNTSVELNPGKTGTDTGCVVRRIFGCNDLNGTPKGHASVHVYATQHRNKLAIHDISKDATYQKYEKYGNVTLYTPSSHSELATLASAVGISASDISSYETAITNAVGDNAKNAALDNFREAISEKKYDVLAVYGGGNLAPYVPTNIANELASVVIDGCMLTSIKQVYGGGNAAYVPATSVRINEAYEIDEAFGGGNGRDSYLDPRDNKWYQNPGANVGYSDFTHKGDESGANIANAISQIDNDNADTPEKRKANYALGSGVATTTVTGGRLHKVYGGSNRRGNISNMVLSVYQEAGTCDLVVDYTYGAGKDAATDAKPVVKMDCVDNMDKIFGGSTNADVYNDIELTITNGTYKQVYGGNDTDGAIYGSITVNIEEGGCRPITIGQLYAGGYLAPYSKYGYEKNVDGTYKRDGVSGKLIPLTSGESPKNDPCINVISASRIDSIFGGGYQAAVVGNPHVNVNMKAGRVEVVNMGTNDSPIWKDNQGKESEDTHTYTSGITEEIVYYVSNDGLRVEVTRREKTESDVLPDDSGDYEENISGTIYVYQATNGTSFYKTGDVMTRTKHWATLPLGYINNNIYGGGNQAEVIGDTYVEIGTGTHHDMSHPEDDLVDWEPARNAADIRGSVFGGGLGANAGVTGNTYVTFANGSIAESIYGGGSLGDVGTMTRIPNTDIGNYTWAENTGECNVNITGGTVGPADGDPTKALPGNVFGGGKGNGNDTNDTSFYCENGMAYKTNVSITNGMVKGSVFGGGEIGRVENNTSVTIGDGDGVDPTGSDPQTSAPTIEGDVFGGGKGLKTHGYSALVRGNPTVTVQGNAKIRKSVYGGGEIGSVGSFWVNTPNLPAGAPTPPVGTPYGMPYQLKDENSGTATITVKGYAEIGPDDMAMTKPDGPDDTGYIFGAGKGILPEEFTYEHKPKRMVNSNGENTWQYFDNEPAYVTFIETLAMTGGTDVTVGGNAFVKGSVYGGSENGHVLNDTKVTIADNCQIGNGYVQMDDDGNYLATPYSLNRRYTATEWAEGHLIKDGEANYQHSLPECASWPYGKNTGTVENPVMKYLPYDKYDLDENDVPVHASDGHTFYGNVFGGGSGLYPYRRKNATLDGVAWTKDDTKSASKGQAVDANGYSDGVWLRSSGAVYGNTEVNITGGHILTNVYGGNEMTEVGTFELDENSMPTIPKTGGTATVKMSGGTLGVPRTLKQIEKHPVTCYLFGASKGDQRINFNTWTNVNHTVVEVTDDARIYGSVFGGGEDGHVLGNTSVDIKEGTTVGLIKYPYIGTTGTSYVDGNIFGGGRGFSGEALTAGSVGGNVTLNISDGTMLGSVYGGGRLASVGTKFTSVTDPAYGQLRPDETTGENPKTHGHITINISGGIIGNDVEDITVDHPKGGNVFGGSMGRLFLLDGTTMIPNWPKMAVVKTSKINISGDALIKGNVYGGGELGMVRGDVHVTIGGILDDDNETITSTESDAPTIMRDVYGGGYGSNRNDISATITASGFTHDEYTFTPMQFAGIVCGDTYINMKRGWVKKSIYGGGEMATVGLIDFTHAEKHESVANGFGLSWPYKLDFIPYDDSGQSTAIGGSTYINVTGGRLGITGKDFMGPFNADGNPLDVTNDNAVLNPANDADAKKIKAARRDNGDIYGGGKGLAGDRYEYAFCANVKDTHVTIDYPNDNTARPENYMTAASGDKISNYTYDKDCIAGAVYGGGDNGHVIGNTEVTLKNGLIGHSLYGGGSGKGKFTKTLQKVKQASTDPDADYTASIYSITAGKVYGNTKVKMEGGYVVRNIYGGGNLGSVGKGNYSGGADDYSTAGYGETLTGNLWNSDSEGDNAWQFLNSGKTEVEITGGQVGYVNATKPSDSMKDDLPYGNIFGGCRGESAPNIQNSPRYEYSPEFFSGYVNESKVTVGDAAKIGDDNYTGPTILGSVFGGGQDGHVRRDAHVIINKGEIGMAYNTANQELLKTTDLDNPQWLHRGNVYGAGSGIGKYEYDLDYNGKCYEDANGNGELDENEESSIETHNYYNPITGKTAPLKEVDYSTSAGSVTRFTTVDIFGGTIHRNVYGGGSLASVGAPKIPVNGVMPPDPYRKDDTADGHGEGKQSMCTVTIGGVGPVNVGTPDEYQEQYGGEVYGASRGLSSESSLGSVIWTQVNIKNGANIQGNVYGGGDNGMVKKDTDVQIGAPTE